MPQHPPAEVIAYGQRINDAMNTAAPTALEGAYLHGSAAFGGFIPTRSDVDVLAVVSRPIDQHRMATAIRSAADDCPGSGLEMSVITTATAASLGDCPFEVHIATTPKDDKTVLGEHHPGDPDLVLHVAVCRQRGIPLSGPPPEEIFGDVPRRRVLAAMADELRWGLAHATEAYAVLNACRALRYLHDGQVASKVDGGRWALQQQLAHADLIARAVDLHATGANQAPSADAIQFVKHTLRALTTE